VSEHSDLCAQWHGHDCDCADDTVQRQESEISELINETNSLRAKNQELREILEGFMREFGDKAMNANVKKARAVLKEAKNG
jgi:regulator of replication initiation timing